MAPREIPNTHNNAGKNEIFSILSSGWPSLRARLEMDFYAGFDSRVLIGQAEKLTRGEQADAHPVGAGAHFSTYFSHRCPGLAIKLPQREFFDARRRGTGLQWWLDAMHIAPSLGIPLIGPMEVLTLSEGFAVVMLLGSTILRREAIESPLLSQLAHEMEKGLATHGLSLPDGQQFVRVGDGVPMLSDFSDLSPSKY